MKARRISPPRGATAEKTAETKGAKKPKNHSASGLVATVLLDGGYQERTIWSQGFKAWARYHVKKPKLPTAADKPRWVEAVRFKPGSFKAISGTHNAAAVKVLANFVFNFESLKSMQELLVIHGPLGSGKSMLAYIYTQELSEVMDLCAAQFGRWALTINADEYDEVSSHEMFTKIVKFIEPKMDKAVAVPFRVVIIDNADRISHSDQTSMKALMEKNLMRLRWIFTASSVKALIGGFQTKGVMVQTRVASEKDSLLILLAALRSIKVGFERQGILKLFDLNRPGLSISDMLDLAQKTFLSFHFISEDNVLKAVAKKPERRAVTPFAPIGEEPLPRCKICTLHPPCAHIKLDVLLDRAAKIRGRLPQRGGAMICPAFALTGRCDVFNKHGRCSLDHPQKLHRILEARHVCPLCTILWPCNHCQYCVERDKLLKLVEIVQARLALLAEINAPEPPAYLIRKLIETYEDWRELIHGLARFYLTAEKNAVLTETIRWIHTEYCSVTREYIMKQQTLARTYGEVLKSPLLVPVTFSRQNGDDPGRQRGRKSRGDDENSMGNSSMQSLDSFNIAGLLAADNEE